VRYNEPMLISTVELRDLMVSLARERFGDRTFTRRELMELTEGELKRRGVWQAEDDGPSDSSRGLSKGVVWIDWAISALKKERRLAHVARNTWRVPNA